MMDLSQRKEQWSQVYLRAVATAAGFALHEPTVDDDSVDFTIAGKAGLGMPRPPRIDVQLKGTSDYSCRKDHFVYGLKRKNYDDLRYLPLLAPRLLIVVLIPSDEPSWLRHDEQELAIRRCGYWVSLAGSGDATQRVRVPVKVPYSNLLSVSSLQELMRRAANQETL